MLDKRLIQNERTEIRPVDGKTRGRALGYLEKQIEGRDSSMCAGCEGRVRDNWPSLSLPFLNVITRGYAAALRARSIRPRLKDFPAEDSLNVSYSCDNESHSWTHVTLHQRALESFD